MRRYDFMEPAPGYVEVIVYRSKISYDPRDIQFVGHSFGLDDQAALYFADESMETHIVSMCFKYVIRRNGIIRTEYRVRNKVAVLSEGPDV